MAFLHCQHVGECKTTTSAQPLQLEEWGGGEESCLLLRSVNHQQND